MRSLHIILLIILLPVLMKAQKDFQIEVDTPHSRLQVMLNDTNPASPTYGLGSWELVDSVKSAFTDSSLVMLDGRTDLEAYCGDANYVQVLDSLWGGYFYKTYDDLAIDSALVVDGCDSSVWVRIVNDNRFWLTWWQPLVNDIDSSWSEEIQTALDTISARHEFYGDGTLYIPDIGTAYRLDTVGIDPYDSQTPPVGSDIYYCVELRSNVTIECDPRALIMMSDSMVTYLGDSASRVNIFIADSIQNFTWRGGVIDGNADGQYHQDSPGWTLCGYYGQNVGNTFSITGNGYTFSGPYPNNHVNFYDLELRNHSGNPMNGAWMDSCEVININYSGFAEGWQLNFSRNHYFDGLRATFNGTACGDGFEFSHCYNMKARNFYITGTGSGSAVDVFGCVGCELSDFVIKDYSGAGIDLNQVESTGFKLNDVTIRDGYISSCGGAGIELKGDTLYNVLIKDIAIDSCQKGIHTRSDQQMYFNNLRIIDVTANDNQYQGIELNTVTGIIIDGGSFSRNGTYGIHWKPQVSAGDSSDTHIIVKDVEVSENIDTGVFIEDSGLDYGPKGHISVYAKDNTTDIVNEFDGDTSFIVRNEKPYNVIIIATPDVSGESVIVSYYDDINELRGGTHMQIVTLYSAHPSGMEVFDYGGIGGTANIDLLGETMVLMDQGESWQFIYDATDGYWRPIGRPFSNAIQDHDWYEVGTTTAPNSIDDNIYKGLGNVGIGTTTPGAQLHMAGTYPLFEMQETDGPGNETKWYFEVNTGTMKWRALNDAEVAGDDWLQIDRTGQEVDYVSFPNGNLGINTTTAAQKLHVEGTARITGSDGTATAPMGRDADGDVSAMTEGWGINYTGGAIAADSSQVATQYDLTLISGGSTDLTIGGSGPSYTVESSTGTDVTVANLYGLTLSESPANTLNFQVDSSKLATQYDISGFGTMSNFLIAASGTAGTETVTTGETVTFSETTGLDATRSTNTVSYALSIDEFSTDATIEEDELLLAYDPSGTNHELIDVNNLPYLSSEVDGSTTNELNTIQEGDVTVQTSNSTIDFGSLFDVATDGAGEVNVDIDLSEAGIDAGTEGDEYVIIYDPSTATEERVLITSVTGGFDGNGIYDGDGTTPADVDVTMTDNIRFGTTTDNDLYIDGTNDRVGIGTGSPSYGLHVLRSAGAAIESESAGTGGLVLKLEGKADGGGANTDEAGILWNYTDADYSAGAEQQAASMILHKESDASQWSTLKLQMNENTDAGIVYEKNADFTNTTESHLAINGGIAYTQNYDGSTSGADLSLDRSYYTVNITGGNLTDTIKLPEVASTTDNWTSSLTSAQCQVGQEYVITNARSGVNLVIGAYNPAGTSDDLIGTRTAPGGSAGSAISIAPGKSVIIKCYQLAGGIGYWNYWLSN